MKKSQWLMSLAIILIVFSAASCQQQPPSPPPATQTQVAAPPPPPVALADPSNPCNTGPDNNPNQPILCVDDVTSFPTITVDPDPSVSVNLNAMKTVHWFTKSGTGSIGIVFDSDLLDPPDMKPGKGHTKAKAGSQAGSVKYSIVVQKGTVTSNVIDPTIIIDTN